MFHENDVVKLKRDFRAVQSEKSGDSHQSTVDLRRGMIGTVHQSSWNEERQEYDYLVEFSADEGLTLIAITVVPDSFLESFQNRFKNQD